MAQVIDFVRNVIPANWQSSPSGWTSGNCPMCVTNGESRPDTKGRGGFHFDDEGFRYNCFNCGYSTGWSEGKGISSRLRRLLFQFGVDESDIQRLQLELLKDADVATLLLKQRKRKEPVVIDWKEVSLPEDSVPINEYRGGNKEFIEAVEYLYERGFDVNDSLTSLAKTPGRMLKRFIRSIYKGRTVGYTARWIGNPKVLKYFNLIKLILYMVWIGRQRIKILLLLQKDN